MVPSTLSRQLICHRCPWKKWISQTLPSMNLTVQTSFKPIFFYSTNKSSKLKRKSNMKQNLKQSMVKPVYAKVPVWLANIHKNLMKSVTLSPSSNGSETDNNYHSPATLSELLTVGSSIQNGDRDKIVFALCRNFDFMSVEEILTAADILYMNGVVSSSYTKCMIMYLYEMIDTLQFTPSQIVRIVFHFQQFWPIASALMMELEGRMEESLSDFTINQVAQVCQLLFYRQYRFKSMTLIDAIGKKLLDEFDTIIPENLPMMMKAFRYSNYVKVSFYKELGDFLGSKNFLNNFSNAAQIMHFAFAFASVHITHHKLFKHLLRRIQELEQPPRMKDLSKIIWACGTLVTTDQEHLEQIQAILDTVKKNITIQQVLRYPDNLMDFLVGLAYLNIYPLDLIEQYLGQDTIQVLMNLDAGRSKFQQLEFLDASLTIECPEFKRKLLSEAQRLELVNHLKHLREDVDIMLRKPMVPTIEALRDMIGEENVHYGFVLPHFKTADILLAFDQEKKCFIIPQRQRSTNDLNFDHVKSVVVMLLSKAQTSYDDQPLGMLYCKLRQLKRLGYSVIQINADEALTYMLMDKAEIQQKLLAHISVTVDYPITN